MLTFWDGPILNRDLAWPVEDNGFHSGLLCHGCDLARDLYQSEILEIVVW